MTTSYNAGLDTSNVKMSYAIEAVWATIPVVVFQQLRITGEDFTSTKTRVRPLEINPSGYAQHSITTKVEAKGSFNFGFSFATFDDFINGALNASGVVYPVTLTSTGSSDLNIVSSGSLLEGASGRLSTVGGGIKLNPGDTVVLAGYTNAANNGRFTVDVVTGSVDTASLYNYGTTTLATLVTEAGVSGQQSVTRTGINNISGDIALTAGGGGASGALVATTGHPFQGMKVGQWVGLQGFTNAGNNGVFKITTYTSDQSIIVENSTDTSPQFITETPAGHVTMTFGYWQNGANVTTYSFEKQLASALFLQYVGAYVSSMTLTMDVGKFVEGVFSFLVKSQVSATTEAGTSAPTAAPLGRIIDNISGFSAFNVNGAAATATLQQVELNVSKQRAASQYGIGSAAAVGMRRGTLQVDGKLSLFFKDFTYFNDFINETDLGISWQLTDSTGNAYVITLPAVSIMNPSIVAKGIDQDIIADFTLEGNPASATNATALYQYVTIQIDRIPVTI